MRKIAYVSGTRADFGLMEPVLSVIKKSKELSLLLFTTGMHLMSEFGETAREVKAAFPEARRIEAIFPNDTLAAAAEFAGALLPGLVSALEKDKPDIVLVLGDRTEMLTAAVASLYLGVPVCHVHGGEKTTTVDEAARHAITKLSHLHCTATGEAAERVERMGEEKWRIHTVGAPGLDAILARKLPNRNEVETFLKLKPGEEFILITQHSVSEAVEDAALQMEETLAAAKTRAMPVVVVYPNADAGGRSMIKVIERERTNPHFRIFASVPHRMFLALEREAAVWVGNSSAGVIESASFKTPVVNVGERQKGRPHAENVINVGYDRGEIERAVTKALSGSSFRSSLDGVSNPWGDGKAAPRIVRLLETVAIDEKLLNKQITY